MVFTLKKFELPAEMGEEWTKGAHLGLTASTGQLSDNHDVVRLETYVSSEAAEKGEKDRENKRPVEVEPVRPRRKRNVEVLNSYAKSFSARMVFVHEPRCVLAAV